MKVEIVNPSPEQVEFQKLFTMTDKESIQCLMEEVAELIRLSEDWKRCCDRLSVYAQEIRSITSNQALLEAVQEDLAEYERLKTI